MTRLSICLILLLTTVSMSLAQGNPPKHSVADINGRATLLVKPAFPSETGTAVGADGEGLILKVVVDEAGNVVSAQCSTNCHPLLKDAAELAASTSKFKPLLIDGRAVKYEGLLIYTFVVERVNWERFGVSLESTRQFDNLSLGPVAQILSSSYSEEKARLISLDEKGVDFETRQKGIDGVEESINSKIAADDLWTFETSMAIRRITFWTMASGKTDREELQQAINALSKFVITAPKTVSDETLKAMTAVSQFRVPMEMPETELRQALRTMTRSIRLSK